ncbi:hypothetical protein GWK08_00780 [Leptobacterium flavescens]|uniref:Uncharacterized protein n=1 Tax=Leptobacterium flavescens TaxID=472055 RepID=A0A6P0UFB1_9FLAO|nr:hypothetical protein [Leptobacterium flavescens]NER11961.1 hypothetical protein [Leptobacterium flavescens]
MKKILLFLTLALFCSKINAQAISEETQLHIGAGVVIGSLTYLLVDKVTGNKKKAVIWGLSLSAAAGIAKEVRDSSICGDCADVGDVLTTTLGGAVGTFTFRFVLDGKKNRRGERKIRKEQKRLEKEELETRERLREELKLKI